MFYILAEENDLLLQKYTDSEQVSNMDIWSGIDTLSENTILGQFCPKCNQMCSNYHWGPKRKAKFFSSRYPDMLLTSGSGLIFSERAKNLITSHNLFGVISFEKIDITGNHIPPHGYYDTTIRFAESMIDWEHSMIKKVIFASILIVNCVDYLLIMQQKYNYCLIALKKWTFFNYIACLIIS